MNELAAVEVSHPPEPLNFDSKSLLRRAAESGPGYRGRREPVSLDAQSALAAEIAQTGAKPPAYLGAHTRWIDRRAKLFEAGDYPDKGVTIAASDLEVLADEFDLPVPILIEHAQSPLEIGFLTQVETVDGELFGNLALTEEADALIQKSGAKSLSLGLSRDLRRIQEVSLVSKPRVASARLFGGEVRFWSTLEGANKPGADEAHEFDQSAASPKPSSLETPPRPDSNWRDRFQALSRRVEKELADRKLEEWVREGRIFPAQVPFARALLEISDAVEFDGESRPAGQLLIAIFDRQPPHRLFAETSPTMAPSSEALFLPEEAEFYRRHFPDVSLDVIAARRAAR